MAKRKSKDDASRARPISSDGIEDTVVQALAEAVALLGKKKGKRAGAKWRLAGDPAEVVLRRVTADGQDVAQLAGSSGLRLGTILRALLDLQRFGLVEVSAGFARPTSAGAAVVASLDAAATLAETQDAT